MRSIVFGIVFLVVLAGSPVHAQKWYEGGTLHTTTLSKWSSGTLQNQVATSADFVAYFADNDTLASIDDKTFKKASFAVSVCVREVALQPKYSSHSVDAVTVVCMKQLKKDFPFFITKKN